MNTQKCKIWTYTECGRSPTICVNGENKIQEGHKGHWNCKVEFLLENAASILQPSPVFFSFSSVYWFPSLEVAESTGLTAGTKETPGCGWKPINTAGSCCPRKELWIQRVKMRTTLWCWSGAESRDVNSGVLLHSYTLIQKQVCVCVCR